MVIGIRWICRSRSSRRISRIRRASRIRGKSRARSSLSSNSGQDAHKRRSILLATNWSLLNRSSPLGLLFAFLLRGGPAVGGGSFLGTALAGEGQCGASLGNRKRNYVIY